MMFQQRQKRTTGLLVLWVCLAFLASGATWAQGKLIGQATDRDGNPIEGVEVKMIPLTNDLPETEVKSKKNGKFIFGLLRPAQYRLVAFHEGMRISHVDANIALPQDESVWAFDQDMAPGEQMPSFNVTGVSEITFDLTFSPSTAGPGEHGTGEPVSGTTAIVNLVQGGDLDQALAETERTLEVYPDNPTLYYLKGFVLKGLGRTDEALEAARKAVELDPSFEGGNLLLAKIYEERGDYEKAVEFYEKEETIASSTEVRRDTYTGLASTYLQMDRLEDAAAALEHVVEIAPDSVNAYKELADIYVRLGNQEKAHEMLEKVSELGASDPNVLYNMGAERYNAGDLEAAADYFTKAIEADPGFADAYRQLAFAEISLGKREAAAKHLEKYLELYDNEEDQNVQTAKAILQQLGGGK